MQPDFLSWGLKVGRIAGIVIRIHWILLGMWLLRFHECFTLQVGRGIAAGLFAAYVAGVFGIILLHELGHCFAARRLGGDADHILLWPLGGLAYVSVPDHWRANFLVALAGPLVNVGILLIAWPTLAIFEPELGPAALSGRWFVWWNMLQWVFVDFNLVILIFNLIPLYPLDGGRMFHALAWRYQDRRGGYGMGPYYRATIWTVRVSRVLAIVVLIWGIFTHQLWTIFIVIWAWYRAEMFRVQVQSGVGPETTFGHDFSQGYTSLERGHRAERAERERRPRRSLASRLRSWWTEPKIISVDDARRLDLLLDKIRRDGQDSLSRSERRFLSRMSRRRFPR